MGFPQAIRRRCPLITPIKEKDGKYKKQNTEEGKMPSSVDA